MILIFVVIYLTGATPERREFQYPRQLVVTSPHERILARFRELNDAASTFKIPDDSFKERQSKEKVSYPLYSYLYKW